MCNQSADLTEGIICNSMHDAIQLQTSPLNALRTAGLLSSSRIDDLGCYKPTSSPYALKGRMKEKKSQCHWAFHVEKLVPMHSGHRVVWCISQSPKHQMTYPA